MEIKTKFKVGDLVKHKFEIAGKNKIALVEVMGVLTDTCYAGTQVFYQCRQLFAKKEFEHEYKKTGSFEWITAYSVNPDSIKLGWHKYREDELIESPEGDQAIIKGLLVGNDE